jgi:hypothetical protein
MSGAIAPAAIQFPHVASLMWATNSISHHEIVGANIRSAQNSVHGLAATESATAVVLDARTTLNARLAIDRL